MKLPVAMLGVLSATASAEPLRLRADALATTEAPAGLLVLEADGQARENVSAEAVVWMAGAEDDSDGDVLVIAVRANALSGRANARLGRFVSTLGALRAAHVDGGAFRVRLPQRFDLEAVAGIPVMPGLGTSRSWDWLAGGRVSRQLGDSGSVGVAYAQRRDVGMLVTEEVGIDAGVEITKRDDVGARAAYDVANPGIAEVMLTASHRGKSLRSEAYAIHREASHLLPATSLFSVIGDVPSQRAGAVFTWRAAPRLDLIADTGARKIDDDYGVELVGRARLRLDDRGTSMLGGEVRRSGVADDEWTGLRGTARVALGRGFTASTELELVIPDVDRGRGRVWPWALGAVSWECEDWQAAIAAEVSASPEYTGRFDVLGQLARRWGRK